MIGPDQPRETTPIKLRWKELLPDGTGRTLQIFSQSPVPDPSSQLQTPIGLDLLAAWWADSLLLFDPEIAHTTPAAASAQNAAIPWFGTSPIPGADAISGSWYVQAAEGRPPLACSRTCGYMSDLSTSFHD